MSEELAEFGRWLENEIDRREWKQADFAREGRFKPQSVSRWVRGTAQPSYRSARAIARTLRVPEDAVLVRTGHKTAPPAASSPVTGDDAILADLWAQFAELAPPESIDMLRQMKEQESPEVYAAALRVIVEAFVAAAQIGGTLHRLPRTGRTNGLG